jgi:hypothetical protein
MKPARMGACGSLVFLAACSSSSPLRSDGSANPDAGMTGAAGGPAGTSGAAGTTGAAGAAGSAAGAAGVVGGAAGALGVAGMQAVDASGGGGAAGAGTDGGASDGPIDGPTDAGGTAGRAVDILFMIDDSASMTPLQQKLISDFPTFISALQGLPGGLPSLHIAVVSSSLGAGRAQGIDHCPQGGDQGIFHAKPLGATCTRATLAAGQNFIVADGSGTANFTGDLSDVFSCIAALGANGCGFEHQLASVLRALGADGAAAPVQNAGFLRPGAILQVILLTNEDDCSAPPDSDLFDQTSQLVSDPLGPLQSYRCNEFGHLCGGHPPPRTPSGPTDLSGTCVSAEDGRLLRVADAVTALKRLKSDPSRVLVSAISGPPSPYIVNTAPAQNNNDPSPWPYVQHSCMAADGTFADPAVRLNQWVSAFGGNGLFESICSDTLQPVAQQLANAL